MSYACGYTVDQMLHGPHMSCGCISSDQHIGADSAEQCWLDECWEHAMHIAELQFENQQFGENHPLPSFEEAMAQKAFFLRRPQKAFFLRRPLDALPF